MDLERKKVLTAVEYLKSKLTDIPKIGFLTGTGLSDSIKSLTIHHEFEYSKIPSFPVATVESHTGKLVFGELADKTVLAMLGRIHLYEGYSAKEVAFPIRVMQELGVKYLIIGNAAGGLNLNFSPGDMMIIKDHMNLTGKNPLTGKNHDAWGIRFPDMIKVYDKDLIKLAFKAAEDNNLSLKSGVYTGLCGPSLETPAETRFLKIIGGDAVGFSTIMEAIAGVHAKMKILGISIITNINDPDNPEPATLEGVIKVAERACKNLDILVKSIIAKLEL